MPLGRPKLSQYCSNSTATLTISILFCCAFIRSIGIIWNFNEKNRDTMHEFSPCHGDFWWYIVAWNFSLNGPFDSGQKALYSWRFILYLLSYKRYVKTFFFYKIFMLLSQLQKWHLFWLIVDSLASRYPLDTKIHRMHV
jgi:hypothetical protein